MDALFNLRLIKFDPFQGVFTAVAAKGSTVDRAGERFDFPGSKPYFQKWSDEQYAASNGQSYGNVRLQHDAKKPAGLLTTPIEFNDADETIKVTGKVVDPIAKELLAQGVLTGVSIGGSYVKKTLNPKDGVTDYIASPSEISVVDRPCLKEASFELVKQDGTSELRKFADEKTADELIAKYLGKSDAAAGSFNDITNRVNAALRAKNETALGERGWLYIKDIFTDKVVYCVQSDPPKSADGNLYQCSYSIEGDKVTLGDAVEVQTEYSEVQRTQKALADSLNALTKAIEAAQALVKKTDDECKCAMCESCVKRDFSDDKRKKLAESGAALPDGSFPIENTKDLKNAIQAIGRAKDPAKAKAHIKARAKALGAEDEIPDSWKSDNTSEKSDTKENREAPTTMKTFTPEELQKAFKAVTDHVADCKKAATEHKDAMHKAASDHEAAMHAHCDKIHKAMTGEEVPLETTKAETASTVAKTDDEKIADAVAAAIAKAMPQTKEPTLEEKIAKAVETAMKPILEKASTTQSRPRGTTEGVTEQPKELTKAELETLAKEAQSGDRQTRENAIRKMMADSAAKLAPQAA